MKVYVGIDFGSTNTVCTFCRHQNIEILEWDNRKLLLPSVVCYENENCMVNPPMTTVGQRKYSITNCKRLLGVPFTENIANSGNLLFNAKVIKSPDGYGCCLQMELANKRIICKTPVEVAAAVMKHILNRLYTRGIIGSVEDIESVVIGFPASYDYRQRQATIEAAKKAGFPQVLLISEPVAAALAYCSEHQLADNYIIVYDFGGGTFDTSLLHCSNKRYEVICTQGSSCLGSSDLLEALVEYVVDYCAKYYDLDVDISKCLPQRKYYQDFRSDCEMARISLSSTEVVTINLKNLFKLATNVPKDACEEFTLTRLEYEQLIRPYIDKTFVCIDKLLKEANEICGVTEDKISLVVLVGGTTRTPYIQKRVYERFCGHTVQDINPEECVARGACIYCMKQNQVDISDQALGSISISDHASFSYGIAVQGGRVCRLISKGDMIPVVKSNTFTTTEDNQQYISTAVYIGEGMQISDCRFLHELKFGPIEQRPKGVPKISITYKIDLATMLTVICEEKTDSASIKLVGKVEVKVGSSVC